LDEPPGESRPSCGEGLFKIAAELTQGPTSGRIEIPREPSASTETQCHRASAFDGTAGQHLPDDDQGHPHTPTRSEPFVSFEIANPLLQRAEVRRWRIITHR